MGITIDCNKGGKRVPSSYSIVGKQYMGILQRFHTYIVNSLHHNVCRRRSCRNKTIQAKDC